MFKKILFKISGITLCVLFILLCLNINYVALFNIPNNIHITLQDLEEMNNDFTFGRYTYAELSENYISVGGEKRRDSNLLIKLFGIIPIRKIDVIVEDSQEIYLGGIPLGFSINTQGLIVVGENNNNNKSPFKSGDIITSINNENIENPNDVNKILAKYENNEVSINILRKGKEKIIIAVPHFDESTQEYKLGLWVRDDAQGIGTLTFVTKDGKFGALGHSICDYETGVEIPVEKGGIYLCNLVGINKSEKGKPGEIRCLFSQSKNPNGDIIKNTSCGVFGKTDKTESLIDSNLSLPIGNRMLVKLGKAQIVSSVSGLREEYDIEIIKTYYQPSSNDKSFVFRVIDKRLINLTGGIVQGMSGSPIIQNNKVIGAVTHVFLNDSTKGYGIYIDWMIEQTL